MQGYKEDKKFLDCNLYQLAKYKGTNYVIL